MVDSVLSFIQENNQYAWFVIFAVAFLESMAIIGLLIPGWVLLVGVGTLIGADVLSFYPIAIAAYLGAVIGEYLSFHVGYHYHEKILAWKFVAKHKKLIRISKRFFRKHGASGVFVGRFFGPTRAVVPMAAGICEMSKVTFFWVNLTSGLLWAPLYLLPGILVGAAFSLDSEQGYHLVVIMGLVVLVWGLAINSTKQYWKATYHKQSENLKVTKSKFEASLAKVVLWWSISISCLAILIASPYWSLFVDILNVLWQKL